jgi:hypothetical protein
MGAKTVHLHVHVDGFIKSKKKVREAHSRKCQTFAASQAEPVDLPADERIRRNMDYDDYCSESTYAMAARIEV